MSGLLPKQKPVDRKVFLDADLWERLSKIAEFHTEVFSALNAKETVSRNDIIAAFLDEGAREYWKRVGGEPERGTRDWQSKVKEFAVALASQVRAAEEKSGK